MFRSCLRHFRFIIGDRGRVSDGDRVRVRVRDRQSEPDRRFAHLPEKSP